MKAIMILSILLIFTLGSASVQGPQPCAKHSDCVGPKRPFCGLAPGAKGNLACRPCPKNRGQCKNGVGKNCGPNCPSPATKDEFSLEGPKGRVKKKDKKKGNDADKGKDDDDDSCKKHLDCPRTKPFCAKKKGKDGKGGENDKDGEGDGKKGGEGKGDGDKPKPPRPDGVCKRCNECKRCGDGVDGTCGKKCPKIFPRKAFPLEGAKVCQRDPPKVNCEVCYNGSYMIGCTEYVCIAGEEEGKFVGVKRFEYDEKDCGEKDAIANYCIDWAERR